MAANFAKLPGAAAQADVEGRGVTRLRRTLRDIPRNVRFASQFRKYRYIAASDVMGDHRTHVLQQTSTRGER